MAEPIIVDRLSHMFNAEDLPIDGFIKRLSPLSSPLTGVLSRPVDLVTQSAAPGHAAGAVLLRLLAGGPG